MSAEFQEKIEGQLWEGQEFLTVWRSCCALIRIPNDPRRGLGKLSRYVISVL